MGTGIDEVIREILGSKCEIVTKEEAIRIETIMSVGSRSFRFGDRDEGEVITVPLTLFFDTSETDGVDLAMLKSIKILDE